MEQSRAAMSGRPVHVIKEFRIVHMSIGKVYRYKHLIFERHDYLGPQFLRHKDHEGKDMRHATGRDWGVFWQWWRMGAEKREQYRVNACPPEEEDKTMNKFRNLEEVDFVNRTGPIDDPVEEHAGDCPKCGEDTLWHYPDQHGLCHSGLYRVHWPEHYGCDNPECCAAFVEQE